MMDPKVKQALDTTLRNWKAMSVARDIDESEAAANNFESSFYIFIDAVRGWFQGLDQQPETLEEFMGLAMVEEILELLPVPLHLNFETEAELIFEGVDRIDDEKYD